MKNVQEDLKNLDSLIEYIENDLIGEHKEMKYIDEGIKRYAEAYHEMKLKLLGIPDFMCSCCKSNKAKICDKCNSDMCVSASGQN